MSTRQLGTVAGATIYSFVHYMSVVGKTFEEIGGLFASGPASIFFDACFYCSLGIILIYALPKVIKLNIRLSNAMLRSFEWLGNISSRVIEKCRRKTIVAMEALISWLRSSGEVS